LRCAKGAALWQTVHLALKIVWPALGLPPARLSGALMGEAAAALDLGAPGMSGLADRTERAGLVERRPDETDGRASRLWLTEAGHAARQRSKVGVKALNAKLTAGFTAAEIDVVARWLTSLQTKFPAGDEGEV